MDDHITIILSRQAHQDMMDERAAMMHLVRRLMAMPRVQPDVWKLAELVTAGRGAFGWRHRNAARGN